MLVVLGCPGDQREVRIGRHKQRVNGLLALGRALSFAKPKTPQHTRLVGRFISVYTETAMPLCTHTRAHARTPKKDMAL